MEDETAIDEGHKILYSNEQEKHVHCIQCAKRDSGCVISYTPVNSRITPTPIKLTIIQMYAPTSVHIDGETNFL